MNEKRLLKNLNDTDIQEPLVQMFSYEFCEISKNTFFTKTFPVSS